MKPPIKDFSLQRYPNGSITQGFRENVTLYSRWGLEGHNGIDIVAPHGTPMYAVESGVIVDVKYDPNGFGKHIRLRSDQLYEGRYREWVYGHCSNIRVVKGARVEAGDWIANMGCTGFVVSGATPFGNITHMLVPTYTLVYVILCLMKKVGVTLGTPLNIM